MDTPALDTPRQVDGAASAADDAAATSEADPSVLDVPPGSNDSTPVSGSPRLANVAASLRALGKPAGTESDDQLIEGGADDDEEDLNNVAIAAAESRRDRGRVKSKASRMSAVRTAKRSDGTDSDEPAPVREPVTKKQKQRTKKPSPPSESESDGEDAKKSRYKSVSTSQLHNQWDNAILDLIRKEFQIALLARDGFPAKTGALDRNKNLKQLLVSAKKVLEPTMYKKFKSQVETAFNDTSKE